MNIPVNTPPIMGTIKNEALGIEAPFERRALRSGREEHIFGRFEGHSKTNLFNSADGWTFEEAKPTFHDLVTALTPGTVFVVRNADYPNERGSAYLRTEKGYSYLSGFAENHFQEIPELWREYTQFTVTPIYTP